MRPGFFAVSRVYGDSRLLAAGSMRRDNCAGMYMFCLCCLSSVSDGDRADRRVRVAAYETSDKYSLPDRMTALAVFAAARTGCPYRRSVLARPAGTPARSAGVRYPFGEGRGPETQAVRAKPVVADRSPGPQSRSCQVAGAPVFCRLWIGTKEDEQLLCRSNRRKPLAGCCRSRSSVNTRIPG